MFSLFNFGMILGQHKQVPPAPPPPLPPVNTAASVSGEFGRPSASCVVTECWRGGGPSGACWLESPEARGWVSSKLVWAWLRMVAAMWFWWGNVCGCCWLWGWCWRWWWWKRRSGVDGLCNGGTEIKGRKAISAFWAWKIERLDLLKILRKN